MTRCVFLAAIGMALTACNGEPTTCMSYADPVANCARVDGARFQDAGADASDARSSVDAGSD